MECCIRTIKANVKGESMTYHSTKIKWAGDDCILINDDNRKGIILVSWEVRELIKEWNTKKEKA